MPKHYTFPTLYDECKTPDIAFLKKHGYLEPGIWKTGTVNWSRNGTVTSSIGIGVLTYGKEPFLEFDYKCREKPIKYKVPLVTLPSNIGKGVVWYFVCPNTGKRCRKLYLADTYFLHRDAFRGCMYEKQTYSSKNRILCRQFATLFGTDKAYEQLYSKHFKKYYKGKPTKRYLKLMKQLNAAGSIDEKNIVSALYGNKR